MTVVKMQLTVCGDVLVDTVVFADRWKAYFERAGLRTFDELYKCEGRTVINRNNRRNVCTFTLGNGGGEHLFYMKRFHSPHFKDMLSALCRFGRPTSQARVEWNNARTLLENGIDTYRPVCLAERTVCGIDRRSLVITEELKAISLLDYVVTSWGDLDRSVKERIVTEVARLIRKTHRCDISLPDLYLWHVFIEADRLPDEVRLSLIDLHRMDHNARSPRQKARELGRLYWSMDREYFDDELKQLLVTTYTEGWETSDVARLVRGLRRSVRTVRRRRHLPDHYNRAIAESVG